MKIDTGIRTIELSYEEEKPLTEYENQVIEKYVEMHKIHEGYLKRLKDYDARVDLSSQASKDGLENLESVKKKLNTLLSFSGTLVTGEEKTRMLEAETEKYNEAVRAFHLNLCNTNEAWVNLCSDFNDFFEGWETTFETQMEEFSNFLDKFFENYEEFMLDTESFWHDQEAFKVSLGNTSERMDKLYEKFQTGLQQWESLAVAANLFYDFVKTQDKFDNLNNPQLMN